MDGGAQASATPIYNKFVDIAKAISPTYISMIMPARWYSGGKGLDDFRESMLCDKRITLLHDYINGKVCFPNVEKKEVYVIFYGIELGMENVVSSLIQKQKAYIL